MTEPSPFVTLRRRGQQVLGLLLFLIGLALVGGGGTCAVSLLSLGGLKIYLKPEAIGGALAILFIASLAIGPGVLLLILGRKWLMGKQQDQQKHYMPAAQSQISPRQRWFSILLSGLGIALMASSIFMVFFGRNIYGWNPFGIGLSLRFLGFPIFVSLVGAVGFLLQQWGEKLSQGKKVLSLFRFRRKEPPVPPP